jgi:hypothetical protein
MIALLGVLCSAFGLACVEPNTTDIQSAYERASRLPNAKHVEGLMVVGAQCDREGALYSCQVGFKVDGEADNRVYLDAISLKQQDEANWLLLSGLCLSAK